MPWVVLRFPESETIEAVPAKWYDKANKLCKFPPVDDHTEKELSNFIIEEYDPLEEWPIHEAVLESQTEFVLFNKAHIRASKACNSQNYKSDKETVLPQKRPPKPRKIASSSSEQDSDGSDLVFEHSFPKSKKEQHEKCTPSKSRTHPNIGLENKQEVKTVQETSKPTPTNANAQETAISYLIRIKRTLELQEQKLSEIDRKVDELSTIIRGQQKSTDITDDEVHKKLPLSTLEELGDVEKLLENATNLDNFVIYMRQVGGFDYKESVRRCLKKIFNDQLAVIYSFQGHKGKNPFNKTLICTAVIKSILKLHIDCTSKEVEVAISKWLAKAKERMKKNEEHTINFNLEIKS